MALAREDKAVLRLALGLGLAVLIAYGVGLPLPFAACVLAVLLLSKPGPPIPFIKGAVLAVLVAALVAAGVLMVPLLEHYPLAGLLVTALMLFAIFSAGARRASPLTAIFVIAVTIIPAAGVAEQALSTALSVAVGVGLATGVVVSGISHAFFPDDAVPVAPVVQASVVTISPRRAGLQATLVVMPVFMLALTNPAFYIAAIMKTVTLAQQAGAVNARAAGRELVGSTLAGAGLATLVWFGLTLRPNLWMLMLWIVAAALWTGTRLFGVRTTSLAPSFWSNALITMLILLGPAIEDAAVGKDVAAASITRVALFVGVALYAWAMVWVFERWAAPKAEGILPTSA